MSEGESQARLWLAAASNPGIEAAIGDIHEEVAEAVRQAGPHCLASGRCCRFDEYGHRLYATGLEAARCVRLCAEEGRPIADADVRHAIDRGRCPWQEGRLCLARGGRPVGCRVYFCDPRAEMLVPELAERAHAGIRAVHERFGVPYVYGEWRVMLQEILAVEP